MSKKVHEEILDILRKKSEEEYEYINPNFLSEISNLISIYYNVEDDKVDRWIAEMYGA